MNGFSTLVQALTENKSPSSGIHFINGAQDIRNITYTKLLDRALGLLHHIQQAGVNQGDQLILLTQRNEAFVEGFWAAQLGGVIAVPLSFGISDEHKWKLFRIIKQLTTSWILLDQAHVTRLEKFAGLNNLQAEWNSIKNHLFIIEQVPNFSAQGKIAAINEDDTTFIQFSSGTTSDPKGVVLTHKNLVTNITGIGIGMKITGADTTLSWMPLTHDMGLIGFHLVPLFFGISQYTIPTEVFIRRPLLWLQMMNQLKATVTCSPNFGYQHCLNAWSNDKAGDLNLKCIRLIFNGAEPISVPLINRFLETFSSYGLKRQSMFTVYGLAEASLAVAFPEAEVPFKYVNLKRSSLSPGANVVFEEDGIPFVVEGKGVQGCEIRITAHDSTVLPLNYIGKIEIKGDNVTGGYLNMPGLNEQMINDGWLNTGDLGFLNDEEDLVVTGRAKDIIFINGQNYYPHDIEIIAEARLGIDKGKIAACGVRKTEDVEDRVILFVLHKGAEESFYPQIASLKRVISEAIGISVTEVIPVNKIPKTTSGKVQRYLLGENYLNGEFEETINNIHAWLLLSDTFENKELDSIEQKLKIICEELIPGNPVKPEDNFFEIGATSLLLAQLHHRVDEEFPGKLQISDFFEYPTIKQLSAHLQSKMADSASYS